MKIRTISPRGWPRPRGYANGLLVPAGRQLLFVAGMIGWDETEKIVMGGLTAQFEQALRNVLAVVHEAGGRTEDIVRIQVFVTVIRQMVSRSPRRPGRRPLAVIARTVLTVEQTPNQTEL